MNIQIPDWLQEASSACAADHALLEGYAYTGLARIAGGKLELPPAAYLQPGAGSDWPLYWDIRVFGPSGEWHAWKDSSGVWRDRRFSSNDKPRGIIQRRFPFYGTTVKQNGNWWCCSEERGYEIWSPIPVPAGKTLFLNALLIVDQEPDTGLAGVVDTVIRGLEVK